MNVSGFDTRRTYYTWVPKPFLDLAFRIGFKGNVKEAIGHGLGRHSDDEIYEFGKSDLKSLSDLLGKKDYFFGKEPHLVRIT